MQTDSFSSFITSLKMQQLFLILYHKFKMQRTLSHPLSSSLKMQQLFLILISFLDQQILDHVMYNQATRQSLTENIRRTQIWNSDVKADTNKMARRTDCYKRTNHSPCSTTPLATTDHYRTTIISLGKVIKFWKRPKAVRKKTGLEKPFKTHLLLCFRLPNFDTRYRKDHSFRKCKKTKIYFFHLN